MWNACLDVMFFQILKIKSLNLDKIMSDIFWSFFEDTKVFPIIEKEGVALSCLVLDSTE